MMKMFKAIIPLTFSLIFAASQLAAMASGQDHLDAFVRIIDNNDHAGEVGIYRFTLELMEGITIQTFLPESVEYTPSESAPAGQVEVCREYLISHT